MVLHIRSMRWATVATGLLSCAPCAFAAGEPRWIPGLPVAQPWTGTPYVQTMAVFDEGNGPQLFAGGEYITPAGPPSWGLARWDGREWSPVGMGLDAGVQVLRVLNDGSGPALFVGGSDFNVNDALWDILKWDGASWVGVALDSDDEFSALVVWDMVIYDDGRGGGPALIAAGVFGSGYYPPTDAVATLTPNGWQKLGTGLQSADGFLMAFALCVVDDDHGNGSSLVVGGHFDSAGGVAVSNVASWNGVAWSALGSGPEIFWVVDLLPYEIEVQGPDLDVLVAVGTAPNNPGQAVAMWDGASWSNFGPPEVEWAYDIAELAVGGERGLYVAGNVFPNGTTVSQGVAKWNGDGWDALGSGLTHPSGLGITGGCLESFDDGDSDGHALFVGGVFNAAAGGYPALGIARWGVPIEQVCGPDISPSGGDGRVNIADLLQVISGWGTCDHPCGADCVSDVDGSCAANIADLLDVIGHWGPCTGSVWE